MILACHRIYPGLEQGQSQQVCLSPNVAAEKTPWSFCQHCSIRGADLPIHMDSFVTSGLFFSLCFHTTLAWQLSTLPAASSHSMRAPKESPQLSHGLVFICKHKHSLHLQQFLRFLGPLIQLEEELFLLRHCQGYWT